MFNKLPLLVVLRIAFDRHVQIVISVSFCMLSKWTGVYCDTFITNILLVLIASSSVKYLQC